MYIAFVVVHGMNIARNLNIARNQCSIFQPYTGNNHEYIKLFVAWIL